MAYSPPGGFAQKLSTAHSEHRQCALADRRFVTNISDLLSDYRFRESIVAKQIADLCYKSVGECRLAIFGLYVQSHASPAVGFAHKVRCAAPPGLDPFVPFDPGLTPGAKVVSLASRADSAA